MLAAKINPGKYVVHLLAIFVAIAVLYAGNVGRLEVLILSSGIGLICYGLKMSISKILFFVAISTFLSAFLPFGSPNNILMYEGFKNQEDDDEKEEEGFDEEENDDNKEAFENDDEEQKETFENEDDDEVNKSVETEGFANQKDKKKNKNKKRRPPPNNRDSKQMFELGKKYNIPSEDDDDEYHLDAGTTFVNAYKALNPEQISAMTKDTQELIDTQKQLMNTLNSLKPIMTDGKQIMDTFQNYFGGNTDINDLNKLAEKFSPK
jgi:hypothetical protein